MYLITSQVGRRVHVGGGLGWPLMPEMGIEAPLESTRIWDLGSVAWGKLDWAKVGELPFALLCKIFTASSRGSEACI